MTTAVKAEGGSVALNKELEHCLKAATADTKRNHQLMPMMNRVLESQHLSLERKVIAAYLCLRLPRPSS